MNTILKRVISMVLCFVMLAGYLPVGALAEEIAPVQEPSADTAVVVEEEAAEAEAAVLAISEPEWVLPDCDCGNTEAELGSHGETCARKVFLEEFCKETAADIFAKWENLPEDCQKYILEYLGKDETNAEKLAELNGYVNAAQVASDENEDNTDGAEGNTDGTEDNTDGAEGNTDGTEGNTDGTEGNTDGTEGNTDGTEGNTNGTEDNNDEIQNTEDGTEENEDTTEEVNLDAVLENAVLSVDRGGEKPLAVVYAASDFQKTTTNSSGNKTDDASGGKKIMNNIIAQMIAAGYEKDSDFAVTGALFCGDYTGTYNTWYKTTTTGSTGHKATSQPYANAGANAVEEVLNKAWGLTDNEVIYVQGNHDYEFDNMDPSGANDTDDYGVYVLHEDDFQWKQGDPTASGNGSSNDAWAVTQATANALEAYLKAKLDAKDNRPILIASHVPLHFGWRTSDKNGDNMYANLIFDVINEYANKGLNIIFLFGHNHSETYDDYLGGTAVYLRPGDEMKVPQSKSSDPATKTLAFTYMNAGYVGYEKSACEPAALTSSVLEIYEDKVIVSRYDAEGPTYLQNTGVEDSSGITPDSTPVEGEDTITLKTFHADLDLGTLSNGRMIVGNTGDLTVKGVYNTAYNVAWTSSDDSVVSVTPSADGMSATVTAKAAGTATITAVATEAARAVGDQVTLDHTIEVVDAPAGNAVILLEAGEHTFFKKVDSVEIGKTYAFIDIEDEGYLIGQQQALHYNASIDATKEGDISNTNNEVYEVNAAGQDVFQLPVGNELMTLADVTSENCWWVADEAKETGNTGGTIRTYAKRTYNYLFAIEGDGDFLTRDKDQDRIAMGDAEEASSTGGAHWYYDANYGLVTNTKTDGFQFALYYSQANTDFSAYRVNHNGAHGDSKFNENGTLKNEDVHSRVYPFEQVTVNVAQDITAQLNGTSGYVNKDVGYTDDEGKRLGGAQTGNQILINNGTMTAEIPVTIDMLSGSFDVTKPGTYSGLTVTYAGVVIAEDYTLTVRDSATVLKNDAAREYMDTIYTRVDKWYPGRQYLIVDTDEEGIGHAMGVTSGKVTAHNVLVQNLPVDGTDMLYIDSSRYSSKADTTAANLVGRGITDQGNINEYFEDTITKTDYYNAISLVWTVTQRFFPLTGDYEISDVRNKDYYFLQSQSQVSQNAANRTLYIGANAEDNQLKLGSESERAGKETDDPAGTSLDWWWELWQYSTSTGVHLTPKQVNHAYLFYNWQNVDGSNSTSNAANKNFQTEEAASGDFTLNTYRRTWIYERVTNIDTISARVSDKSATVTVRIEGESEATHGSTFTGDYILVDTTHADGTVTTQQVPINISMLSGTYDLTATGTYPNLTVNYQGVAVCKDYTLIVNNFVPNDYPEFPDEGAVRVDKQLDTTKYAYLETGVASIDLSVTGIPAQTGVDLVVILDASSSMQNCPHGSYSVGKSCGTCGTVSYNETRMGLMEATLESMLKQLKTPMESGYSPDVDVAIATFNGYTVINSDYEFWYSGTKNDGTGSSLTHNSGQQAEEERPDASQILLPFTNIANVDPSFKNVNTDSRDIDYNKGTNYDRAMELAYQLLKEKQELNAVNGVTRDAVVVFMSDGAPYQYNYFQGDPNVPSWANYLNGTLTTSSAGVTNQSAAVQNAFKKYDYHIAKGGSANKHWMAEAIKGNPETKYTIIDRHAMTTDHITQINGLGATMYSIGFGLAGDHVVTKTICETVLKNMATSTNHYMAAADGDALEAAFSKIAGEVRQAGNAVFKDQMGKNFDLVFSNEIHIINDEGQPEVVDLTENPPTITVKSYALYKRSEIGTKVGDVWVTETMVGSRKPGDPTVLETITFSDDGTVISSDKKTGNILNGKVIEAATFWYNTDETNAQNITVGGETVSLESETFYWNVGSIPEDELVLSYSVYLDGSMEGTRPEGTYDTNEFARLTYTNYLGNECQLETVSPKLPWQQGTVGYAFYLVNSKGEPIINQSNGTIGSFEQSVKITQPVYKDFYMNSQGEDLIAETITAAHVMPEGYTLFDTGAAYEVLLDSDGSGFYKITKGDAVDVETTYVKGIESTAILSTGQVDTVNYTTANTEVWFAVTATVQCAPDTVVIDYGLPVEIDVRENDVMMGDFGKLMYLDRADKYESGEMKLWEYLQTVPVNQTPKFSTAAVDGDNGKASVVYAEHVNGKVRYALNESNGMQMNKEETFVYAVNYTGEVGTQGYYYSTVTVIPATTIYYEDNFVEFYEHKYVEAENITENGTYYVKNEKNGVYTEATPVSGDGKTYYEVTTTEGWTQVGDVVEDATQSEDRPGKFSLSSIDANNIYGYDPAYDSMSQYSMGGAMKTSVNADSYSTATFSFCGTGFDVISMTSNTTGVILVNVKNAKGEDVANKFVNTYYGYNFDGTNWTPTPDTENALYQVPVLQVENLDYGTYSVTISASYMSGMDKTSGTDGYDLYLDAIRIYDPANDGAGNDVIEDAYKADGEGWPSYIELRNKLIGADTLLGNVGDEMITGMVFIDGDAEVGNDQIADYQSYGPNNEVYLAKGQKVAFILNKPNPNIVDKISLGVKSANGDDVTYSIKNVSVATVDGEQTVNTHGEKSFTLTTSTDMYYDITDWSDDIIVITNTGSNDGILSMTNIKATYTENPNGVSLTASEEATLVNAAAEEPGNEVDIYMTPNAATLTLRALNASDEDEIPEEPKPEEPKPEEPKPEEPKPEEPKPEEPKPEEPKPEDPEPEDPKPENPKPGNNKVEQVIKNVLKNAAKTLKKLLGGWFR